MGRWRDGHKYIGRIIFETKDGSPALIYNLDHKGRVVYEYPVCKGLPAYVNYDHPGIYTFKPPPIQVYKKEIKSSDPSITGSNSITVNINPKNSNELKISDQNYGNEEQPENLFSLFTQSMKPKNQFSSAPLISCQNSLEPKKTNDTFNNVKDLFNKDFIIAMRDYNDDNFEYHLFSSDTDEKQCSQDQSKSIKESYL